MAQWFERSRRSNFKGEHPLQSAMESGFVAIGKRSKRYSLASMLRAAVKQLLQRDVLFVVGKRTSVFKYLTFAPRRDLVRCQLR